MIDKDLAAHYSWGGDCDGWELVMTPELSIIHERMLPGRREERHQHSRARQFFFVLSGVLTLEVDGRTEHLQAQQGLEIPPLTPHQAINVSNAAVEFLVTSQPTSRGDRTSVP